ncbi:MAG: 50S ribosomal protein L29 [Chromatiales bacterium]|nr:50S ribosomal protein L29 [Chromatiales bacterium]
MKITDLRKKSDSELAEELLGLRKEQFNLRMQRATGQLSRPDQFDKVRKNIARIKTLLGEQSRQKKTEGAA